MSRVRQGEIKRWSLPLLFLLLFFTLAISISGYLYYQRQRNNAMRTQADDLRAVAGLKAREIQNWLDERLGDARLIEANPIFKAEILAYMRDRSSAPRREMILGWMKALRSSYRYQNVLLVDNTGAVVLALNETYPIVGSEGLAQMQAARQRKTAGVSDLHSSAKVSRIHLDVVVPLLAAEGVGGFVFLRIDPNGFLYPLIQSWPTPSPSAETLLVKREGDHVLFLNELRHRRGTALKLRLPINSELPAARAVLGETGVFIGKDYRGVPVWSVSRPIAGTPWFLVAKIDSREVERPIRRDALAVFLVAILLLLAAAQMIMRLWQRRNAQFRERQLETEAQKQALEKQFDYLTRFANDIILLADEKGNIMEASESALVAYGYDREALLKMNLRDLLAPGERETLEVQMRQIQERQGMFFESLNLRQDGSVFPVEVSARIIAVGDRQYFQGIVRDISERKEAATRLLHANRLLALRSQVNRAIIRARDRRRLFHDICSVAVEAGEMRMSWIGLVDEKSRTVRPACQAGQVAGYLDHITISIDDIPSGRGPTGTAIRENRLVVSNDIRSDEKMEPWRMDATRRIYRSSAALPLRFQGQCIGALMMYAAEANFFDSAQVAVLEEVVNDLGYALDALEREKGQRQAEEALRESELKFRSLFETMATGVVYQGADGKIIAANPAAERIIGMTLDQMRGLTSVDPRWKSIHEDGSDFPGPEHPIPLAQRTGKAVEGVIMGTFNPQKNGYRWLKVSATPQFWPGESVPYQVFAAFDDITDLVDKKRELQALSRRLELALQAGKAGSWDWDVANDHLQWSPSLFELFGLDPQKQEASFSAWRTALHPDDRVAAESRIERALKDRTSLDSDYRVVLPGGRIRWINSMGVGIYDDRGRPVQMIGICLDISERKEMELALRASEMKFHDLFHTMLEGVGLHQVEYAGSGKAVDYRFIDVNPAFERILGIPRASAVGRLATELFAVPQAPYLDEYAGVAAGGQPMTFDTFFPPMGKHFHIAVFSPGPGLFATVFEEIGERQQAGKDKRS